MNSPTKPTELTESTNQEVGASTLREDLTRVITDTAKPAESDKTQKGPFSQLVERHETAKRELAEGELANAKSAIKEALRETLLKGLEDVDFVSHETMYSTPDYPDFRDFETGDGSGLITFYLVGRTSGKLAEWLSQNTGNELLTFRFLQEEGIFRCEVPVSAIDRLLARENRDAEPK